jgi:hypothetical protein
MAMTDRNRQRGAQKAQSLLPGTRIGAYVAGRTGPNPVTVTMALLGAFAALSAAIFVATGAFVFPGLLLILLFQYLVVPPRALVLCDQGVALLNRSVWTGRPTRVVSQMPHGTIGQPQQHGNQYLTTLADGSHLWLPRREYEILRAAVGASG